MSFSIQLSSDHISVEAGDNTPVSLEVINRGEEVDRFEVQVEGLDPEWTTVPVPIFTVNAGETQTEKVFFRPSRSSESLAGNYPFVVKVRSLNSGEGRTAQGVLQIKPYNHLSMEIVPKKGSVSPIRGAEVFHVSLMNLGNTEQTLQIYGSDPEDAFAFEFAAEQVTVGPGQQKDVEVRATPTSNRAFATPRLHVFTISARSIQTPSLVASSQAQIEQRPLVTVTTLLTALIVLVIGFGWFLSRPKKPQLVTFTIDPLQVTLGDKITAKWSSANASAVVLKIGDQPEMSTDPSGTFSFTPGASGTITAYAAKESNQSKPQTIDFVVNEPPRAPLPVINAFDIKPRELPVGQAFIVEYSVNDATEKLTLVPAGRVLDPKVGQIQIPADKPGVYKCYLVAENANGRTVNSKTITVRITDVSDAHVVFFDVQPQELEPPNNQVTVTWQTTDAARAVLSVNGATEDLPDLSGKVNLPVQQSCEIQLIVYDDKGRTARSQRISVHVTQPPPPSETTGATTGGTNGNNNPQPTTGGGI